MNECFSGIRPVLIKEVQHLWIILDRIVIAGAGGEQSVLCTGMAMIKGNIKGERGGQTFRKPVFSCNVFLDRKSVV